jgi:hypothetical protein
MSDDIVMTPRQLRRLLARFQQELDSRGGKMTDGSEPQRMLNSNVVIKG